MTDAVGPGDGLPAGGATATVLGRYGSHPAPGGAGRGLLLLAGDGGAAAVLVGCGSGVAGRLGYALRSLGDLAAVVLPDLRPDHACDLWSVGSAAAAAARGGRRRGLLPVYAYGRPPAAWTALHRPGVLDVRRFAAEDTVRAGGWTFRFAPLEHPWPTLALRAEHPGGGALGWVGPGRAGAEARALLAGVRLLLVDAGGPAEDDEGLDGGMAPEDAGALAAAAGALRLLLCHLDPDDAPAELLARARAAFPSSALALEGRTYEVGDPSWAAPGPAASG